MFRVNASEIHARIPKSATIVLAALAVASILSLAAVYQVLEEYRLLGAWLTRSRPRIGRGHPLVAARRRHTNHRPDDRRVGPRALHCRDLVAPATPVRRHARALNQIKLFARDILASMNEGVITTDRNDSITSVNSAAIRILGVDSDCVGRPLARVSPAGLPLTTLAREIAERGQPVWDRDFTLDHGGRLRRIARMHTYSRLPAVSALGCLFLLRDVSDRVLIEERIRRMERIISLGTLASGLHHEIKNPLTALSIHVQLLDKRLRDPEPRRPVDELIGVLKAEVIRLNGVLESFHDFASLRRLNRRPADVFAVLEEIVRLIAPQAERQRVEVTLPRPETALPRAARCRKVQAGDTQPGDQRPGGDARGRRAGHRRLSR